MIPAMRKLTKATYKPFKIWVRYKCYPVNFLNYLKNLPTMQYCKLSNGLNVVTEERECYNACIGLFLDSGSRYEDPNENGMSHLFEHLAFKGTFNRTKTVLEDQISCTGARFKCYTTREMNGFYAECLCEDVPLIFDILTDCVFNNALSPAEIELQKCTIYQEMLEQDKNTRDIVNDYLHTAAFQGTSLAQTVMGPTCNLYKFNAETICSYRAKTFDPTKMVLASVGGVKHEQIIQLATSIGFDNLQTARCVKPFPCRYTGSDLRFRDDSMSVAHVAIAVEGPPFPSEDHLVMSLAAAVVGGWDKSQAGGLDLSTRVARSVSTSQLCESYKAFNLAYKDTGLWGVEFVSPLMVTDDMIFVIQDEWMRLCTILTEGELDRAKQELKTKLLTNSESVSKTCRAIGRWILYNKYKTSLYERLCAIDDVKVKNVKETCYKYLYDKCPVVVGIGATECLPDYTRVRAGMYWLRF